MLYGSGYKIALSIITSFYKKKDLSLPFPGHLFKIMQNLTNPINLDGTFELIVNKAGMEVSVLGLFLVPSQEYLPFLMS